MISLSQYNLTMAMGSVVIPLNIVQNMFMLIVCGNITRLGQ
jgi:hypothetical protein